MCVSACARGESSRYWDLFCRNEEEDEDDPSELEQVIDRALCLATEDASRSAAVVPTLSTKALPIQLVDWRQWSPLAARSTDSSPSDNVSFSFPTVGSFLQAGEGFSSVFRATPSPRGNRNRSSPVSSLDAPALPMPSHSLGPGLPTQALGHFPPSATLSPSSTSTTTSSHSLPQTSPSSLSSLPEEEQTLFDFELQSDRTSSQTALDLQGDDHSVPAVEPLPTDHHLVCHVNVTCGVAMS
jgi:hypothetical protein